MLLLLPLACCSDRPSHPSPGLQLHWLFPATSSSSSIQPCRASPFPRPPAAGHGESRRGCDLKLLVQLQTQDLGDRMLKLLLNSSRNLHRAPAWQREGALIAQSLGEKANLPLFRLSHIICTSNPNLYKGDHRSSQTFRNINIAASTRASPTVQDRYENQHSASSEKAPEPESAPKLQFALVCTGKNTSPESRLTAMPPTISPAIPSQSLSSRPRAKEGYYSFLTACDRNVCAEKKKSPKSVH